jgi:hypothetical protein
VASPAQSVTLTNTGNATLTVSSIAIGGTDPSDFSETNTCGTSVAAGANCTVMVTFTPTATGSRSATVDFGDNASGSPQTLSLSGTVSQPAVSLSSTSLTFTSTGVGVASTAQSVTLTNTGNATLALSSIAVGGTDPSDFSQTNTCGSSVAAGANCAVMVTFKPTTTGTRSAALNFSDNASGSPQTVSLSGSVSQSGVSVSPTSLTFTSTGVGVASPAQSVTLTNSGSTTLIVSSITIGGADPSDFSETNTCGSSVAAGANCTVMVVFTPTATGSRTATLSFMDNASGSPQTVGLSGSISSSSSSVTIEPSLFGITLNDPQDYPTIPFGTLGKSPAIGWWWVEPTQGTFDFSLFDQYVEDAQAHGIDYLYELGNSVPPWASSDPTQPCNNPQLGGLGCAAPPTNISDWDTYVTAVVTHYKGQVEFYELWNEPNNPESWSGTYAQLVSLAKDAYSIVKSIDPDAMVLTPATTGPEAAPPGMPVPSQWLQNYLQAGGNLYADIGTFHGYIADQNLNPTPLPEQSNTSPNCGIDCYVPITTKVDLFRSVLDNNGLQNAPLFDTEGGWSLNFPPDDDGKVEFVSRWYILQAAKGVARVVWFLWGTNSSGSTAGLGTSTAPLTPAAIAYGQVYDWLTGATFGGPCSVSGTVWSCQLTRPNGYQALIVWNTAGSSSFTVPSQYIQFQDLTGNTTKVSGGTVTIGLMPILLENQNLPQ